MTIDELEAERLRWTLAIRRAPAWSAEGVMAEESRCACEAWLRYRKEEETNE